MPELPEVETVKRQLKKVVLGCRINQIEVLEKKQFFGSPEAIIGQKIKEISRRAKVLIIGLDSLSLLIHLKMTGQIIYLSKKKKPIGLGHPLPFSPNQLPNKATRVIIQLDDGSRIFFNDLRKFGWLKILTKSEAKREFSILGPEPLRKDFKINQLKDVLAKTSREIKIVLMDQTKIAGIGNIYANEILFKVGLNPRRQANLLSNRETEKLYQVIREVLLEAIKHGGTSAADKAYLRPDASLGRYQNFLKVYQREGKECFNCSKKIKKIIQAGRGTFFCSKCQE